MPENKTKARTFRGDEAKGPAKSAKARRDQLRRRSGRQPVGLLAMLERPALLRAALVALAFAVLTGTVISWTRERPLYAPGRVMPETREVREPFEVESTAATAAERELVKMRTPRIYRAEPAVFQEIASSIENLPTSLADATSLAQVAPEIREAFGLTQQQLDAVRGFVVAGEADQAWAGKVRSLMDRLRSMPIVDRHTYQLEQQQASMDIELRLWDGAPVITRRSSLINVESDQLRTEMRRAVEAAGFEAPVASLIIERLSRRPQLTFTFDRTATERAAEQRAEMVAPVMVTQPAGRVLGSRGEPLSEEKHALLVAEHEAYLASLSPLERTLTRVGAFGAAALVTVGACAYIGLFAPRIRRNTVRMIALASGMFITLAISAIAAAFNPSLITLVAIAPTIFVAVVLAIAYDRRTAFALAAMHALLVGFAIDQSLGFFGVAMAGVIGAALRLRDVRQRNTLIYAGVASGLAMVGAVVVATLLEQPLVPALLPQALTDAGLAGAGGVLVGFIVLGVLPTVERIFDITTGMTLVELRDPKQPLLRELQQRAPGTYQHSFTVATLAENAADAIGADGLHLYVGALYHDIGKMNKPDYFVENQSGGFSRHEKLSPAMSLLVIVGHVKDGMELAREYNIPRSIHHYIESHHGTTLVEYFYHAAQQKAEAADTDRPQEIEYRYPGPKPRTKEAAILMICDAVESATRAMSDPTPARIDALVHEIAGRRLMDGQFDDSELTLRELHVIEASLIKTLCSIYHGRISYPTGMGRSSEDERPRTTIMEQSPTQPAAATVERTA